MKGRKPLFFQKNYESGGKRMIDYKSLIEDIWSSDGKAYLVGGWVRDMLLGRVSEDIDMEVIGLPREKFEEILKGYGKYYRCGKAYEIYILGHDIEISYIEEEVEVREAARRRDFTINSLYYNPLEEKIYDYYNGREDIEKRTIRYVDRSTFLEDPLRILRVAEMASRFSFEVDPETVELMRDNRERLREVAGERVAEELRKVYLLSPRPSRAFQVMEGTGALEMILPRLVRLQGVIQDKVYHPEGDVYTHILMMLDVLPVERRSMEVFWGIIYHDMGKEETWPEFRGHAVVSKEIFQREGGDLVRGRKLKKSVESLIEYHEEPLRFLIEGFDRIGVKKLAVRVELEKLLDLYLCDVLGRGRKDNSEELETIERIRKIYEEIKGEMEPIIRGRDLIEWGVEDRSTYSEIIGLLFEAQLEEKFCNKEEAWAFYLSRIKA